MLSSEMLLSSRRLSFEYQHLHLLESASFFARKSCSFSQGNSTDILLLAQLYLSQGLSSRSLQALSLSSSYSSASSSASGSMTWSVWTEEPAPLYWRMKALRLKEDWRGLLAVLDELFQSAVGAVTGEGHREGEAALTELERLLCERRREERRVAGGVLGLAAEAFEALEDYDMASRCWMAAMRVDPCCVEVFQKLVIDARIQADSARQLLQSLQFSQDEEWVRDVFSDLIETTWEVDRVCRVDILAKDYDLLAAEAWRSFYRGNLIGALDLAQTVLAQDEFHQRSLMCYIACLVELRRKNELFLKSHQLVESYPDLAISWYAVGAYYLLCEKYDDARKHFRKAVNLDSHFLPAHIGIGHSYAFQRESDQSLSTYRSILHVYPGQHILFLFSGMEYAKSNLNLSRFYLQKGLDVFSYDPQIHQEIGVLEFRQNNFGRALEFFERAIHLVESASDHGDYWDAIYINKGHALRKLGLYDLAIATFEQALLKCQDPGPVLSALGLTHHLLGNLEIAIDFYHKSLAVDPGSAVAGVLISKAISATVAPLH